MCIDLYYLLRNLFSFVAAVLAKIYTNFKYVRPIRFFEIEKTGKERNIGQTKVIVFSIKMIFICDCRYYRKFEESFACKKILRNY